MKHTVVGIFSDREMAGKAVSELKRKGFTKDISVIYKDVETDGKPVTKEVKRDMASDAAEGAGGGAVIGGAIGAITGLLVGAATLTIPGTAIAIVGPLAASLAGAGVGGTAGTIVGALVDMGIPNDQAKEYQEYVEQGETLVAVTTNPDNVTDVENILASYQSQQQGDQSRYGQQAVSNQ